MTKEEGPIADLLERSDAQVYLRGWTNSSHCFYFTPTAFEIPMYVGRPAHRFGKDLTLISSHRFRTVSNIHDSQTVLVTFHSDGLTREINRTVVNISTTFYTINQVQPAGHLTLARTGRPALIQMSGSGTSSPLQTFGTNIFRNYAGMTSRAPVFFGLLASLTCIILLIKRLYIQRPHIKLPIVHSGSIDANFRAAIETINLDTCKENGENAFYVCDLASVYRLYLRWQQTLSGRVEPFFGKPWP